jgi:CRP/FNR family transcriptional regulator, cyclic AMP receptor protein
MDNKLWYLKRSKLFERASDEMVRNCEHFFTQQWAPAKTRLFDQGDDARTVYLLKQGQVRIVHLTENGKEILVSILGEGDIFGEEVAFDEANLQRTNVAYCSEPTLLCVARAEDLFKLLLQYPILALNVAKYLREQRDDALAVVEDVAFLKVQDRLTRLLDRLAAEHGVAVQDGTLLDLRLTHAEIASLIGSTRESVSAQLSNLAKSGYLRTEGKSIVLLNRSAEHKIPDATRAQFAGYIATAKERARTAP